MLISPNDSILSPMPVSCARIVGAKRPRSLAGHTPVGMLDRAAIRLAPHPSSIPSLSVLTRGGGGSLPSSSGRHSRRVPTAWCLGYGGFARKQPVQDWSQDLAMTACGDGRAVGHSTFDKGRRAAASFSSLPWGLRLAHPLLLFVHRRPAPAPTSLPGPSGRLNTATIPRCWSPEPTPNGTNRRAGKLLEM